MTREEACAELVERHECAKYVDSDYVDAVSIEALEIAIEALKAQKHGEWTNEGCCTYCGENKFKGLVADVWADWQPNFCPNCGASMREEGDKSE